MPAISGTFVATGQSESANLGDVTLSLSGWGSATVSLQRSFDGGTTWVTVETWTAAEEVNIAGGGQLYRLNCTVWASGTITYYLG
jgi:hypothetical protein|tara:strand:+ start:3137 stop:3391 length:255 start_codon:yes stop_codon:yes gene_type:complete